jgi:glycosyltransferase involved in cell wall biosynthesis
MIEQNTERIHCHLGDRKLYVGFFCKLLLGNVPLSVTIHAHELYLNPNWKLFPIALEACDHIICIADLNKKNLMDKWKIPEEKLKVIRLSGFSDLQKTDPTIIFCVGRYESKKGHDILLDAISQLIEEGLDIELWLAGSPVPGSNGVDVLGYAKNIGIENRVVAFGEVGAKILKVLYRESDIFCLLSRHDEDGVPEGIPVVLMEAMSMGKPVVATDTGATSELVKQILIKEEDTQAAVDAIRRLVNSSDLRKIMGKKNIDIIKTSYSKKNVEELFKVLRS